MMDRYIPLYCESRSLLSPVTDALHLVYGSPGCDTCLPDINRARAFRVESGHATLSAHLRNPRGLTNSKRKLYRGLISLIEGHEPAAAFVYTPGRAEVLGEEVDAVCNKVEKEKSIPVIPVHSEGLKGERKAGDRSACEALFRLMGTKSTHGISLRSVNILGGFHNEEAARIVAGQCRDMGIDVVAVVPGSPVADFRRSHGAALNLVLDDGPMMQLAMMMKVEYGIPVIGLDCVKGDATARSVAALTDYFTNHRY